MDETYHATADLTQSLVAALETRAVNVVGQLTNTNTCADISNHC